MNGFMSMVFGITKLFGENNLKAKCARGAMALGVGMLGGRAIQFLRNLILALILAPESISN